MELHHHELDKNILLIKLTGDLDIKGVSAIEKKFTALCAGDKSGILVDISGISFLSSIGIRLLAMNAKSIAGRGGKMLLLNPKTDVRDVLEMTGINLIIPVYEDLESARAALPVGQ